MESTDLDVCVLAWLKDARHFVELECSAILLAKSILPAPSSIDKRPATDRSISAIHLPNASSRIRLNSYSSDDSESEIVVIGKRTLRENQQIVRNDRSTQITTVRVIDSGCTTATESTNCRSLDSSPCNDGSMDSACGSSPAFSSADSPPAINSPSNNGRRRFPNVRKETDEENSIFFLPSYANSKNSIERLLNISSRTFSILSKREDNGVYYERVVGDVEKLLRTLERNTVLPIPLREVERTRECLSKIANQNSDEFRTLERATKKLIQKVHVQLAEIVIEYLSECRPRDRHLEDALNHLTHLALFTRKVCSGATKSGAVGCLTKILKRDSSPECRRLSLRSLAVLCSLSEGCVQLFSVGGLELVTKMLHNPSVRCSVEAAGVLTQLTSPGHSFAAWPASLPKIVIRLLELCDLCENANSFLLCSAALANLSIRHASVSEVLYRHNAVRKFCRLYSLFAHDSVFALDQIATVFARLAANGYERALVAQGATPCLLTLLRYGHAGHPDLAEKIRSKAAVCVGTLGVGSFGLQAISENDGLIALRKAVEMESRNSPIVTICNSVLANLLKKYRRESTV